MILIGGAIWGIRWWTVGRFIQTTDDAYLQADNMTVAPKVSGYVAEVFVADNQAVTAGQPLVRLDNRQYQAMLEQANASIAARKADIERAEAELRQQQANIVQARAQVLGARAAEAHAIAEVKRYEPLVATGAESAKSSPICAMRRIRRPRSSPPTSPRSEAAERQPATTRAQIDQARAQLQAAAASVASGAARSRRHHRSQHPHRAAWAIARCASASSCSRATRLHDDRAGAGHLSHRELQGNADRPHARRPACDDQGRCAAG